MMVLAHIKKKDSLSEQIRILHKTNTFFFVNCWPSGKYVNLFLIFLLTIPHRFSMGFKSGEFAGQSGTQHHGHLTNFWFFWQCGQVPNPAGK